MKNRADNSKIFIPYLGDLLPFMVIFERTLWRQSGPPAYHHQQPSLENRKFFFGTATFLVKELFGIKVPTTEEAFFQSRYFLIASTISEELHFGKKHIFQKSNIPHYPLFRKASFLRADNFWKDILFYSSYLFRRATLLQHTFSEELPFHSYGSFPQLHVLFIS